MKKKSCKKKYKPKKSRRATSTHEFLEGLATEKEGEKEIKDEKEEQEVKEETEEEEIVEENLGEDNEHLEDEEQEEE
jgi:hypothetical protein